MLKKLQHLYIFAFYLYIFVYVYPSFYVLSFYSWFFWLKSNILPLCFYNYVSALSISSQFHLFLCPVISRQPSIQSPIYLCFYCVLFPLFTSAFLLFFSTQYPSLSQTHLCKPPTAGSSFLQIKSEQATNGVC